MKINLLLFVLATASFLFAEEVPIPPENDSHQLVEISLNNQDRLAVSNVMATTETPQYLNKILVLAALYKY